jgi:hypothetical protein
MADQEYCLNGWGKAKVKYRSKAQAEKTARRTKSGLALHTYSCRWCGSYHLSSQPPRNKPEAPPLSPSKLRRKLADAAAQIKAAEKRLSSAERDYLAELAYVTTETERIFGRQK